jgi:hypothetical protein
MFTRPANTELKPLIDNKKIMHIYSKGELF